MPRDCSGPARKIPNSSRLPIITSLLNLICCDAFASLTPSANTPRRFILTTPFLRRSSRFRQSLPNEATTPAIAAAKRSLGARLAFFRLLVETRDVATDRRAARITLRTSPRCERTPIGSAARSARASSTGFSGKQASTILSRRSLEGWNYAANSVFKTNRLRRRIGFGGRSSFATGGSGRSPSLRSKSRVARRR